MAYLATARFKAMARIPQDYVDAVEMASPGWTQLQLDLESAYLDSLLAKRYVVPFHPVNTPLIILRWLVDLVSIQVLKKRGFDATQLDAEQYVADAVNARKDLGEAANSETGLFELPLRSDSPLSGISKSRVKSYSETSPFLGQRLQRARGRDEDVNGTGTRR
jgi:hypothetical protein